MLSYSTLKFLHSINPSNTKVTIALSSPGKLNKEKLIWPYCEENNCKTVWVVVPYITFELVKDQVKLKAIETVQTDY